MHSTIKGIKLSAVAVGVPDKWLSLEEQYGYEGSGIDEKTIKRFKKNVGVEGKYVSNEKQTNSDWCCAAADHILEEKGIDRNQIGVMVYVTQTSDYREPATALVLQHRLRIGTDCIVFDINLGCSGYVYGLNVVSSVMMQCDAKLGLLLCGETGARPKIPVPNEQVDTENLIFGDAGSATLLVKDENAPDMHFLSMSDGNRFKAIIDPWGFYRNPVKLRPVTMDGVSVFNFSTQEVPEQINGLMELMHTTPEDYDFLVLHQANKMIMKQIEKKTGFPEDKSLKSIDHFANTSSASIATALVRNIAGTGDGPARFLMSGYGIGLSWSVVDCYINKEDILPLIKTSDYYVDGFQEEPQLTEEISASDH